MDPVYLKPLRTNKREGFKGKTLKQFLTHLKDSYEATPEERDTIQKELSEPWDTSQHIKYMFERVSEGLETIANMDNNNHTAAQFIEAVYMVVKKTKQFTKACERWKRLPAADRQTAE